MSSSKVPHKIITLSEFEVCANLHRHTHFALTDPLSLIRAHPTESPSLFVMSLIHANYHELTVKSTLNFDKYVWQRRSRPTLALRLGYTSADTLRSGKHCTCLIAALPILLSCIEISWTELGMYRFNLAQARPSFSAPLLMNHAPFRRIQGSRGSSDGQGVIS